MSKEVSKGKSTKGRPLRRNKHYRKHLGRRTIDGRNRNLHKCSKYNEGINTFKMILYSVFPCVVYIYPKFFYR